MLNKTEHLGFVDGGVLEYTDPAAYKESLKMMFGEVRITIEKRRAKRSDAQNKWYWGICIDMVRDGLAEQGHDYSPAEVHEAMKWKFLQRHEEGIELPTVRSTTTLSTVEFNDYKEKIQRWSAECLHINIPDPQENL